MIRPDQIPDAVVEAAAKYLFDSGVEPARVYHDLIPVARDTIAIALAAWPEAEDNVHDDEGVGIFLPLPQEAPQKRINQENSDE